MKLAGGSDRDSQPATSPRVPPPAHPRHDFEALVKTVYALLYPAARKRLHALQPTNYDGILAFWAAEFDDVDVTSARSGTATATAAAAAAASASGTRELSFWSRMIVAARECDTKTLLSELPPRACLLKVTAAATSAAAGNPITQPPSAGPNDAECSMTVVYRCDS
jgi:hypothetical protein